MALRLRESEDVRTLAIRGLRTWRMFLGLFSGLEIHLRPLWEMFFLQGDVRSRAKRGNRDFFGGFGGLERGFGGFGDLGGGAAFFSSSSSSGTPKAYRKRLYIETDGKL